MLRLVWSSCKFQLLSGQIEVALRHMHAVRLYQMHAEPGLRLEHRIVCDLRFGTFHVFGSTFGLRLVSDPFLENGVIHTDDKRRCALLVLKIVSIH